MYRIFNQFKENVVCIQHKYKLLYFIREEIKSLKKNLYSDSHSCGGDDDHRFSRDKKERCDRLERRSQKNEKIVVPSPSTSLLSFPSLNDDAGMTSFLFPPDVKDSKVSPQHAGGGGEHVDLLFMTGSLPISPIPHFNNNERRSDEFKSDSLYSSTPPTTNVALDSINLRIDNFKSEMTALEERKKSLESFVEKKEKQLLKIEADIQAKMFKKQQIEEYCSPRRTHNSTWGIHGDYDARRYHLIAKHHGDYDSNRYQVISNRRGYCSPIPSSRRMEDQYGHSPSLIESDEYHNVGDQIYQRKRLSSYYSDYEGDIRAKRNKLF